jgi:hypothetical protein
LETDDTYLAKESIEVISIVPLCRCAGASPVCDAPPPNHVPLWVQVLTLCVMPHPLIMFPYVCRC